MYILIKNQEGESMNLLSQNTDFNALLAAMKTDIEAEYEKATGYAIDLDEDSGSDYEVGINVEDSAADGFCLASGYMYGADSNFDWGIFKVKSQKNNKNQNENNEEVDKKIRFYETQSKFFSNLWFGLVLLKIIDLYLLNKLYSS